MTRRHLLTSAAGVRWEIEHTGDGKRLLHGSQEIDGILDGNAAMRTHNDGYTPSREMRRAGRIPMQLLNKWMIEEGWDPWDPDHSDRLMRKLNDIDFFKLRTAEGRLGPDGEGGFR